MQVPTVIETAEARVDNDLIRMILDWAQRTELTLGNIKVPVPAVWKAFQFYRKHYRIAFAPAYEPWLEAMCQRFAWTTTPNGSPDAFLLNYSAAGLYAALPGRKLAYQRLNGTRATTKEYVDIDYWHKLTPAQRRWLVQFVNECYNKVYTKGQPPLLSHDVRKRNGRRKELGQRRWANEIGNGMRNCVYSQFRARNMLIYANNKTYILESGLDSGAAWDLGKTPVEREDVLTQKRRAKAVQRRLAQQTTP